MNLGMMVFSAFSDSASGPSVSAQADGDSNSRAGTCYVGVAFNTDGVEYERVALSGAYTISQGNWLDSGSASDVWVEFIRTSGSAASFTGKSNSTRYQISSTQEFGIDDNGGTNSITGYFVFHDAASGGNVLQTTSSATWSATDTGV